MIMEFLDNFPTYRHTKLVGGNVRVDHNSGVTRWLGSKWLVRPLLRVIPSFGRVSPGFISIAESRYSRVKHQPRGIVRLAHYPRTDHQAESQADGLVQRLSLPSNQLENCGAGGGESRASSGGASGEADWGGQKPHFGSAERPKRAALPPQDTTVTCNSW